MYFNSFQEQLKEKTSIPPIKKEVSKTAAAAKTAEESPKKEKLVETAKPLKREIPAVAPKEPVSVESHKVKETGQAKQQVIAVPAKKAVPEKKEEKTAKAVEQDKPKPKETKPVKEKEVKPPAATKDKEHVKEKEVKHPAALKDKEHVKEKTVKTPEIPKDKEPVKRKEVKPPAALKEKEPSKEKEEKPPVVVKERGATRKQAVKPPVVVKEKEPEVKKEEKPAKPAPVKSEGEKKEPEVKKEEKPAKPVILEAKKMKDAKVVLHPAAEGKKVEAKLPTTVVEPHEHKHEPIKQEKAVSHAKPEEKIKQEKTVPTEKSVKSKPAKHKAVRHEKEVLQTKSARSKVTAKPAPDMTVAAKKKKEKAAKEREAKTEKKHPKEGKAKAVPTVKEILRQHNLTTEKISKAAKTAKEYAEIISIKKDKAPVRFFQCVFLDGYNGYGLQFPITPAPSHEKRPGQPKTSGRKSKTPGQ
uniref:Triadin n=1 Tax=Gopherus agassizii TaxID=38772 RepID=A0A452HRE9_9SAUR